MRAIKSGEIRLVGADPEKIVKAVPLTPDPQERTPAHGRNPRSPPRMSPG